MQPYVLVVGYRQQLAAALQARGISYSVWTDKPLKTTPKNVDRVVCTPFPKQISDAVAVLNSAGFTRHPTHCIAGSESAVFPTGFIGRALGISAYAQYLLSRCTDKAAMKQSLQLAEVPMSRFLQHNSGLRAAELVAQLGLPLVIKNRRGSGGRDMVFAHTVAEVEQAMGPDRLYETFIDAPEGSIESFIQDGTIHFTNVTEYYAKGVANILPATFDPGEQAQIRHLNRWVIQALGIPRGMVHLEFYRSGGRIIFGELALRPPGGYIMELIHRAYGFNPWDAVIDCELGNKLRFPASRRRNYAASVVFHPGAGTVVRAKKLSSTGQTSLIKSVVKVKLGDEVATRYGVNDEVGYCLFAHHDYQQVVHDVQEVLTHPPIVTQP